MPSSWSADPTVIFEVGPTEDATRAMFPTKEASGFRPPADINGFSTSCKKLSERSRDLGCDRLAAQTDVLCKAVEAAWGFVAVEWCP